MRLISFKTLKLPAIVICMLAAGICYSCGNQQAVSGKEEMVLALEESNHGQPGTQAAGTGRQEEAGQDKGGKPQPAEGAPGKLALEASGAADAGLAVKETDRKGAGAGAAPDSGAWSGTEAAPKLFVHVCGKVRRPGVYSLPEGSRVCDAIDAAGGFEEDGAREYLNLAEMVQDGMKLDVPSESQAKEWKDQGLVPVTGQVSGHGSGMASGAVSKVNLNKASREELMSLRGIGESRAEDIIRYRETYGGFQSIEDIMNVSGIKDAAFEKIKDSITV